MRARPWRCPTGPTSITWMRSDGSTRGSPGGAAAARPAGSGGQRELMGGSAFGLLVVDPNEFGDDPGDHVRMPDDRAVARPVLVHPHGIGCRQVLPAPTAGHHPVRPALDVDPSGRSAVGTGGQV